MLRFVGTGFMMLALAGCQNLPALVRIDVDGSTLEFKKKEPASPPPAPAPAPDNGADAPAS
jgi:hypothetical protein